MITNLDPKPWRSDDIADYDGKWLRGSERTLRLSKYDPRPEFDVGDNPILRAFAENPTDAADLLAALGGPGPDFDYTLWESSSDESKWDASVTSDDGQIAHARTVLEAIVKEK